MKYLITLGALLLGTLGSVQAHTYYSYPTYTTYVYEEPCEYVPVQTVPVIRRAVAPVRYYYPTYRQHYRTYYRPCHRPNPFRGGFSFTFGF